MYGVNNGEFGIRGYSELEIMECISGYYLGTRYTDCDGFSLPGTRESDFFSNRKRAEYALKQWKKGNYIKIRKFVLVTLSDNTRKF